MRAEQTRVQGPRITLDHVSFSYGEQPVLRELSASISGGEFVCLLGSNGAGKSTLARLISGELRPTGGQVSIETGDAQGEGKEPRLQVSYLPQDLQDPPFLKAKELVALGRFKPKKGLGWRVSREDKEAVEEMLARCLAEPFGDRPFAQLSGGEKQRVWLAFCLAQERDFLLLDESLHKIDYPTKDLFFRMLAELADEGKGVILITHDLLMAERHGRRTLVLSDGELIYNGPPTSRIYAMMAPQSGR